MHIATDGEFSFLTGTFLTIQLPPKMLISGNSSEDNSNALICDAVLGLDDRLTQYDLQAFGIVHLRENDGSKRAPEHAWINFANSSKVQAHKLTQRFVLTIFKYPGTLCLSLALFPSLTSPPALKQQFVLLLSDGLQVGGCWSRANQLIGEQHGGGIVPTLHSSSSI